MTHRLMKIWGSWQFVSVFRTLRSDISKCLLCALVAPFACLFGAPCNGNFIFGSNVLTLCYYYFFIFQCFGLLFQSLTVKDTVRECLEKDPAERTDDDIEILLEFMQHLPVRVVIRLPIHQSRCLLILVQVHNLLLFV